MYNFSETSKKRLKTCHKDIQAICNELIKYYDFSVIEGHRTLKQQQEHYINKRSKLDGIVKKSKHQSNPSMAIDIMPYKKGTNAFSGLVQDAHRFYYMMGLVKHISLKLKEEGKISHNVRFGLDWDSDDIYSDQSFHDLPHIEIY